MGENITEQEVINRAVHVITQRAEDSTEDKDVIQAKRKLLKCFREITQDGFTKLYGFNIKAIDEFAQMAGRNGDKESFHFSEFVILMII
ncbi:unnamed protein product [Rodentolepis nana]|uniref:Dynein light chain n=1 Tax=Rodentolepis nana TaxID=102285 RepID=A0A0R3TH98_RODNA|nr:unnamed protein product [Rodentolepis nana]